MRLHVKDKDSEIMLGNDKMQEFEFFGLNLGVSYDSTGTKEVRSFFSMYVEDLDGSIKVIEFDFGEGFKDFIELSLEKIFAQGKTLNGVHERTMVTGKTNLRNFRKSMFSTIEEFMLKEFNVQFGEWFTGTSCTDINNLFSDISLVARRLDDYIVYQFSYFISNDNTKLLHDMLSYRPDIVESEFKSLITRDPKYLVHSIKLSDVTDLDLKFVVDFVKLRKSKKEN